MKSLTILLVLLVALPLAVALDTGVGGEIGVDLIPAIPVNYSLVPTVNNSEYWGGLHTPADIDHNLLNNLEWSVAGHTIDTNFNLGNWNLSTGGINISDSISGWSTIINGYPDFISSQSDYVFYNAAKTKWIGLDISVDNPTITCWNSTDGVCNFIDNIESTANGTFSKLIIPTENPMEFSALETMRTGGVGGTNSFYWVWLRENGAVGRTLGWNASGTGDFESRTIGVGIGNSFDRFIALDGDDVKTYWGLSRDVACSFTGSQFLCEAEVGTPVFNVSGFSNFLINGAGEVATDLVVGDEFFINSVSVADTRQLKIIVKNSGFGTDYNTNDFHTFSTDGTERLRINDAQVRTTEQLAIQYGGVSMLVGADNNADTLTNSVAKVFRMSLPHYTNAEEPVGLFIAQSTGTQNIIDYGGGSTLTNAANIVRFWAAVDDTTVKGRTIMEYDAYGVNITGNLSVSGNFTGNQIYGEMYNYTTFGTFFTVDLITQGVYVNLTNMSAGSINGFNFTSAEKSSGGSYLTAFVDGVYKVDFGISFEGVTAGGTYGFSVAKNFDETQSRECYRRRDGTGNLGALSITCIINLNVGDTINVKVEDESDPVKDIMVDSANLNILRVGNL